MSSAKELYQKAIDKWGIPMQIIMAIEEMAELEEALLSDISGHKNANVEEELADVSIMVDQLRLIFKVKSKSDRDIADVDLPTMINMAISNMSKLTKALCKHLRDKQLSVEKELIEIAPDLHAFLGFYDADKVKKWKTKKLERLEQLLS